MSGLLVFVYVGDQIVPGLLRWCETDFATIHSRTLNVPCSFKGGLSSRRDVAPDIQTHKLGPGKWLWVKNRYPTRKSNGQNRPEGGLLRH